MPLIVGNPQSRPIMQAAHNAYCQHGLSVQGQLPAFRACRIGGTTVKEWFWSMALVEWCHVEKVTAYRTVADLARAAKHTP